MSLERTWNHPINILKFIASFFVVTIHCQFPGEIGQAIKDVAQFAVPLFFMISGYYVYADEKEVVRQRCRKRIRAVIWMIVWSNVLYLLYDIARMCISDQSWEQIWSWFVALWDMEHILDAVLLNASYLSTHLWYLQALLYCYLLCYVFSGQWKSKSLYLIAAILLGIHFVYNYTDAYQVQYMRNVWFEGMPAFVIGIYFARNREKMSRVRLPYAVTMIGLGVVIVLVETMWAPYRILYLGNVVTAIGCFVCANQVQMKEENICAFAGRKLAGDVYIFHPIFIYGVFKVFDKLRWGETVIYEWAHPVLTWISTVVFVYVWYLIKKVIRAKKEIIQQ